MESSRIEPLTLVAVVVGAAVLGSLSGSLGIEAAAAGDIAILLSLFGFDTGTYRSTGQSLGFGAASGFCLVTPVNVLATDMLGATMGNHWYPVMVWAVAAIILFSVDRFRMSSRESVTLGGASLAGSGPISVGPMPVSTYRPAPIRVEPVAAPAPAPTPVYQPPAYQPPVYQPPPAPEPVFAAAPIASVAAAPMPAAAAPVYAPPDVTAVPPGREALIYINLVGEGLNVLRTVRAENLGRDYFRIADIMPESEQWEFTPGMVVRCRKKSLSNGKHMVAFEEAPRAQ